MENTQQKIHLEKEFEATVSDLYDAWINPDKLKQWWQPAGNQLVTVVNELQENGNIKYEFEDDEHEKTILITGQYKEVKPAQRLVYSWNWQLMGSEHLTNNHVELTIGFSGNRNGSKIEVTQTDEDNNGSIHPRDKGWEDELESLRKFLS